MSNLNDDLLDDGLQGLMGKERCQNVWTIMPEGAATLLEKDRKRSDSRKAVDASWKPVPHDPTQMERLKNCAKDALLYGGLSSVFFYFQMAEQMSITASMICIVACVLVGGIKIGKHSVEV